MQQLIQDILLWCTAFNFVLLTLWLLLFTSAHAWMYQLHRRWFRLSPQTFDAIHYAGMATYKLLILFFNLVPYLVLRFF
jgi:hypothetical protein